MKNTTTNESTAERVVREMAGVPVSEMFEDQEWALLRKHIAAAVENGETTEDACYSVIEGYLEGDIIL